MRISFLPLLQYADNTQLNAGTGGDIISTDVITTLNGATISTGEKAQRVKPGYGVDGTFQDVTPSNGLPVQGAQTAAQTGSWTSATALNTAVTLGITNLNTVSVALAVTSTITGGAITFEVSPDGANWFTIQMARIDSYTPETIYTLVASTNRAWSTSVDGFVSFRVRLSTVIAGTATVSLFVIGQVFAIEPLVTVGQSVAANLQATITPPSITKGTQGTTGVTTQDLKDAGRSQIMLAWEEMAATAAVESTLTNFTSGSKAGAALTAATNYTVTSGKTLRIQSVVVYIKSTSTAFVLGRYRIRMAASSIANTSPIIFDVVLAGSPDSSVGTGTGVSLCIPIPDGLEIASTNQITFTWLTSANTATVGMTIIGYEY